MPGEDEESAGERASHMVEARLLVAMMKAAIPKPPDQQTEVIAREAVGHPSEAGEMAEVERLVINVTGVINGDTNHLNVQKQIKLDNGVHMWHIQRKHQHLPKKQKMLQRQGKLWCCTRFC